jgi:hypothetical protein
MVARRSRGGWLFLVTLALSTSLWSADWPTFAHDSQRSGWAFEETTLKPHNAAQLELKWKVQVKNQARCLFSL